MNQNQHIKHMPRDARLGRQKKVATLFGSCILLLWEHSHSLAGRSSICPADQGLQQEGAGLTIWASIACSSSKRAAAAACAAAVRRAASRFLASCRTAHSLSRWRSSSCRLETTCFG